MKSNKQKSKEAETKYIIKCNYDVPTFYVKSFTETTEIPCLTVKFTPDKDDAQLFNLVTANSVISFINDGGLFGKKINTELVRL